MASSARTSATYIIAGLVWTGWLCSCAGAPASSLGVGPATEDAGLAQDAAPALDAGVTGDAASFDASSPDAGLEPDAGADAGSGPDGAVSDRWAAVEAMAAGYEIEDLVLVVGDETGIRFVYDKGAHQIDSQLAIASATKWYSAAIFARLIDRGVLALSDHPQDHLDYWTSDPTDPRSEVTLEQLLSFTSGMADPPVNASCTSDPRQTLQACARELYDGAFQFAPGTAFYYGSSHFHVAAAMAEVATGSRWVDLVAAELAGPLGLSADTGFVARAANNPLVAGGMRSTARDYATYLEAFFTGRHLPNWTTALSEDRTAQVVFEASPVAVALPGSAWHYALGHWIECNSDRFDPDCVDDRIYSSPGAFGFYPWIDRSAGYWGVLAVQLPPNAPEGTPVRRSYGLVSTVRPLILEALAEQ